MKLLTIVLATTLLLAGGGSATWAKDNDCTPDSNKDLILTGECNIPGGTKIEYRYVYILDKGVMTFLDDGKGDITIYAAAILVENGGTLKAGSPSAPFGKSGNRLTIELYGSPQGRSGVGVACKSTKNTDSCGAPPEIFWGNSTAPDSNGMRHAKPRDQAKRVRDLPNVLSPIRASYPGPQTDYFYGYHPLDFDDVPTLVNGVNQYGYFGYKVLGVGYGGTLQLFGYKGAIYPADAANGCDTSSPKTTGKSWVRLAATAEAAAPTISVETPKCGLGWADKDDIVITSTDYLPGHSEQRKISGTPTAKNDGTTTITLDRPLTWVHNGTVFPLDSTTHPGIQKVGLSAELTQHGAETRAAVGLLTRSIRIVSGGATAGAPLPAEDSAECKNADNKGPDTNLCYFGGHTVFRQGHKAVQIQGVEFFQMGQGGRIGHYPVHFHHSRRTQKPGHPELDTFVMDSSVWDSMTRWIVLHGTQDVTLARNVGYKSIGHGFYLEDATEINNKLLANLGVYARGAVASVDANGVRSTQRDNPRAVPGILVANDVPTTEYKPVPWRTDADAPTVFWITNGWNDFQYNVAAGAGTCGACYWFLPAANSTSSRDLKWESYASMQDNPSSAPNADFPRAGMTPLKSFIGNSCSTAMFSFNTVGETDVCHGVGNPGGNFPYLEPIKNPLAKATGDLSYFPSISGGFRQATLGDVGFKGEPLAFCAKDADAKPEDTASNCTGSITPPKCGNGANDKACTVTVLDGYTSSFHWAPYNFAALWLRNQWYLLTNSVITDVQNGGVNFVTGGGYDASSRITGLWQLVYKSVFIGQAQPEAHAFARDGGPFNKDSGLQCDYRTVNNTPVFTGNVCLSRQEGVGFPLSNFAMGQRLLSFYDGPAVQDSNAYLFVQARELDDCKPELLFRNVDCPLDQEDAVCHINCHDVLPEKKHRQCQRAELDSGRCAASPFWKDANNVEHQESHWMAGQVQGLPRGTKTVKGVTTEICYMPNAAIAWKQPNGFYYPPAFRSRNLFFGPEVAIRHFVVEPLFKENSLVTDLDAASKAYCKFSDTLFNGFTSNDRQTVLLDEDGTLTGFTSSKTSSPPNPLDKTTTVVNLDHFLAAPVEATECLSAQTSRVTPFEYVTTVVYPGCALGCGNDTWSVTCTNENCYGVPMYRQDFLPDFDTGKGTKPFTPSSLRLMGQDTAQRSSITVNHGTYYLDTAVSSEKQHAQGACPHGVCANVNVFQTGQTYYLFTLYAKSDTKQTYQIYVGKNATFDAQKLTDAWLIQADIATKAPVFKSRRTLTKDEASYDPTSGILTVTLDHSKLSPDFTKAAEANCAPKNFCQWTGGKCVDLSPAKNDAICRWAVVDLDCPDGGCFGIGFKLPDKFVADNGDHRPKEACLKNEAPWNLTLVEVNDGTCPTPKPTQDFCK